MTANRERYGDQDALAGKRRNPAPPQAGTVGSTGTSMAFRSVTQAPQGMAQASDILALQGTLGNQAVSRMLQRQPSRQIQRDPTEDKGEETKPKGPVTDGDLTGFTPNFATPLSTDPVAGYQVTVAVSQKVPELFTFAKQRMKSTTRNEIRKRVKNVPVLGSLVRAPKSGDDIKKRSAEKAAGKQKGTTNDPEVKRIMDQSSSVGHSWIKVSTLGANNAPIQTYSFGFVPKDLSQAHGPQEAIPGQVRNPDLEFEKYTDFSNRYQHTNVNTKQFNAAVKKISQLSGSPPAYRTSGYNCTQFAHDVAKSAGAAFPSNAGMVMPFSDRGFMKKVLMPNALYDNMDQGTNTSDTSNERTMLNDGKHYEGDDGIQARPVYVPPPKPRGLVLTDIMADEGSKDAEVEIEEDEIVEPTGATFGQMMQVDYKGQQLYAPTADLIKHLKQQKPEEKKVYKLVGGLSVKPDRGVKKTIPGGTDILVIETQDDEVRLESPQPTNIRGNASLLEFWCAKTGVDIK